MIVYGSNTISVASLPCSLAHIAFIFEACGPVPRVVERIDCRFPRWSQTSTGWAEQAFSRGLSVLEACLLEQLRLVGILAAETALDGYRR